MFVRSRPSRTRWTISLSWARSDSTTKSIARPSTGRASDGPTIGHQRSSGSNQACGPLPDVAADDIEHQIDAADVFQRTAVEVDKLLRAEVERLLTVGGASSADHVGASQSCELRHPFDPTAPARAVRDDAFAPPEGGPCSNTCNAVRPEIGRLAPTVKSTSPGSGARLRASIATYSARVPSRCQSARPKHSLSY